MKAVADNKFKVIQVGKFFLDKMKNIVGREENAGYQQFLFYPQCLKWLFLQGCKKSRLCCKELTNSHTITPFDAPGEQAF